MLNPQKWTGKGGVVKEVKDGEEVVFEVTDVDEKTAEDMTNDDIMEGVRVTENVENVKEALEPSHASSSNDSHARSAAGSLESSHPSTPSPKNNKSFDRLQLLVSLDTALELIQVDRDSLKRAETFVKYPGKVGTKVREAIEEIFIFLLKAVGDRHIAPGFKM